LNLPRGSRKRFSDGRRSVASSSISQRTSRGPLRPYALLYNATAVGWKLGSCSAPRMHPRAMACRRLYMLRQCRIIRQKANSWYCHRVLRNLSYLSR